MDTGQYARDRTSIEIPFLHREYQLASEISLPQNILILFRVTTTTREPLGEEVDGKNYNFITVEQFENDIKMGRFVQTCNYHGQLFGLTVESVEVAAREGLACVVAMELEVDACELRKLSFRIRIWNFSC